MQRRKDIKKKEKYKCIVRGMAEFVKKKKRREEMGAKKRKKFLREVSDGKIAGEE